MSLYDRVFLTEGTSSGARRALRRDRLRRAVADSLRANGWSRADAETMAATASRRSTLRGKLGGPPFGGPPPGHRLHEPTQQVAAHIFGGEDLPKPPEPSTDETQREHSHGSYFASRSKLG